MAAVVTIRIGLTKVMPVAMGAKAAGPAHAVTNAIWHCPWIVAPIKPTSDQESAGQSRSTYFNTRKRKQTWGKDLRLSSEEKIPAKFDRQRQAKTSVRVGDSPVAAMQPRKAPVPVTA